MLAESSGFEENDRALAAVAFADVVNYSAMMATDERLTFETVHHLLHQIIGPLVDTHRGVVVKWTGDGALARFGSALDAVRWGEAVQRASIDGLTGPAGGPLQLRISINLGDVILRGNDIFGDGVNVAARLLEHSPPGGIALSEAVFDAVRGSVADRVADLGLRRLKNLSRPARVFALMPIGGLARAVPAEAAVPSIAVLPLQNLGQDPADDYFADGVVEDIIVSLSGLGELMVVSRASTLAFAGLRRDPQEVGRALGVRYVATGSVRRSEQSIRVNMQLSEALTGRTIWSEAAEAAPGELFAMQDRIVGKIVAGIAPNVRSNELRGAMRKHPNNLTAYDQTLQALHLMHTLEEANFAVAGERLKSAIAEDSTFAMPHAWLAWWYMTLVGQGRSENADRDISLAGEHSRAATELDPNNALALAIHGHVRSFLCHQYDIGMIFLERALAASPSSSVAWVLSAASLAYNGEGERSVQHALRGLRLSPLDRYIFVTHNVLCMAYQVVGDYSEAIKWGRLAHDENPSYTATHRLLIGSLMAHGQVDEAKALGRDLLRLEPSFDVSRWERTLQPFRDRAFGKLYADRLRMALLP